MMQKDFAQQLIKGKIAEVVFDQMFREAGRYTVIPFGYETVLSDLHQYFHRDTEKELFETVRNAPDFALVTHEPEDVHLVEVKYKTKVNLVFLRKDAAAIYERWKLASIFVATPEGFFFDHCRDLAKSGSELTPLSDEIIPNDLQEKYRAVLNEFVGKADVESTIKT